MPTLYNWNDPPVGLAQYIAANGAGAGGAGSFKGSFLGGTDYNTNDLVTQDFNIYACVNDLHPATVGPVADPTNWQPLGAALPDLKLNYAGDLHEDAFHTYQVGDVVNYIPLGYLVVLHNGPLLGEDVIADGMVVVMGYSLAGVNTAIATAIAGCMRWLGAWSSGNDYHLNAVVSDGGVVYVCLADVLGDTTAPADDPSNWQPLSTLPT